MLQLKLELCVHLHLILYSLSDTSNKLELQSGNNSQLKFILGERWGGGDLIPCLKHFCYLDVDRKQIEEINCHIIRNKKQDEISSKDTRPMQIFTFTDTL